MVLLLPGLSSRMTSLFGNTTSATKPSFRTPGLKLQLHLTNSDQSSTSRESITMTERKKNIGFMDLPGEIRNTIYYFAIPNGYKTNNTDRNVIKDGDYIRNEPGILRTNERIRNECLPLFYGRMNCFEYNTQRFSKLRLFAR
jgi:hypothetical protein